MYVQWILRIGVFGTFLGHGIFALQITRGWIPFLTVVGFTETAAVKIMPIIGIIDIVIALFALIKPVRIILLYATIWAFCTALIRPVVGLPIWAFVERTSNWAIPLALLMMRGGLPINFKELFK